MIGGNWLVEGEYLYLNKWLLFLTLKLMKLHRKHSRCLKGYPMLFFGTFKRKEDSNFKDGVGGKANLIYF